MSGYKELDDKLVAAYGNDYRLSSGSFTTANNVETYDLSSSAGITNFYKARGVDAQINNGLTVNLKQYVFEDRNVYQSTILYSYPFNGPIYRYRIEDTPPRIHLKPTPTQNTTITVWYTPERTTLVSGSDTVNIPQSWDRYIVNYAAIQALQAESLDTTMLEREQARISQQLDEMAANRDSGQPQVVAACSEGAEGRFGFPWYI